LSKYVLEIQLTTSSVVKEPTLATSSPKIVTEQDDERVPSAVRTKNLSSKCYSPSSSRSNKTLPHQNYVCITSRLLSSGMWWRGRLPPFIRTSHDNFLAFNILNATPDLQKELSLSFVISCTYFRPYVQTTSGVHPDSSPM